ncbi:MAG: lytic transglycosylase domain-containing protein [Alphaproteobacteria bacterium]|nr:lytic transglycosylase domain-containing protein [Alphaproteobacteria bacterium]
MLTAQAFAACIILAANTYKVPPAVMIGIMHVEGGRVGQEAGPNFNGTYDLGPMQVNTRWIPTLQRVWRVDASTARSWVRDNGCVNVHVAAWILRQKLDGTGSLWGAIAAYHSLTPSKGIPYANKVIAAMDRKGLVKHDAPLYPPVARYAQK